MTIWDRLTDPTLHHGVLETLSEPLMLAAIACGLLGLLLGSRFNRARWPKKDLRSRGRRPKSGG